MENWKTKLRASLTARISRMGHLTDRQKKDLLETEAKAIIDATESGQPFGFKAKPKEAESESENEETAVNQPAARKAKTKKISQ